MHSSVDGYLGCFQVLAMVNIAAVNIGIHTLMAKIEDKLKSLLMKVKEESEITSSKLNIQKTKIMASVSITS